MDELKELASLHSDGALSDTEYKEAKAAVIAESKGGKGGAAPAPAPAKKAAAKKAAPAPAPPAPAPAPAPKRPEPEPVKKLSAKQQKAAARKARGAAKSSSSSSGGAGGLVMGVVAALVAVLLALGGYHMQLRNDASLEVTVHPNGGIDPSRQAVSTRRNPGDLISSRDVSEREFACD